MKVKTRMFCRALILLMPLVAGPFLVESSYAQWSPGASIGVLGSTPDGTAVALNAYADHHVGPRFSLGPLGQLAFTGDLFQIGVSGQAKYWLDTAWLLKGLKMNIQGGIGLVHANFLTADTSWLIPLGVGLDYPLTSEMGLTTTFLVNLTDLDTSGGSANVMPGFTVGVRF